MNGRTSIFALILIALSSSCAIRSGSCDQDPEKLKDLRGELKEAASMSAQTEQDQFQPAEPRQQFKVFLGPSQASKRLSKYSKSSQARRTSSIDSTSERNQVKPPKITNAALKELLNQSLLKPPTGLNGSSPGKKSNFKFVFIQRANSAQKKSPEGTKKMTNSPPRTSHDQAKPAVQQPSPSSLAASVSKHLASSLFYSASNLVGNLTSSPSLTTLVAQTIGVPTKSSDDHKSTTSSVDSNTLDDIRRIQTIEGKVTKKHDEHATTKKKRRPSKIYNLPVKFVANGQPNSVVFSTIKQHFATIKKLQTLTDSQNKAKRRKQQQLGGSKSKGNSRLIYLPLKYLSNARPNRLMIGKATHKTAS